MKNASKTQNLHMLKGLIVCQVVGNNIKKDNIKKRSNMLTHVANNARVQVEGPQRFHGVQLSRGGGINRVCEWGVFANEVCVRVCACVYVSLCVRVCIKFAA